MAHTDFTSDQVAKFEADPRQAVKVNEWGGRVRMAFFSFTAGATGPAIGETIGLVRLPQGARVLHGRITTDTATVSAAADIGIDGDVDKYAAAASLASVGGVDFADTQALNLGTETTEDEDVFATVSGAALAAGTVLNGYMLYVLD